MNSRKSLFIQDHLRGGGAEQTALDIDLPSN